jgi:queuine tRNA-ribosyltransferase
MADAPFELLAEDPTGARRGRLHLPHGAVETPVFMPVGTAASVKAVDAEDLEGHLGAQIVLGNTYHLYLRPGHARIRGLGGLHRFMGFSGAILTDSGGYQVFSLAERRKIEEAGVTFASHLDGSRHMIRPETSIEIQEALGSDVIMAFDECPPADAGRDYLEASLARTTRWLDRCVTAWGGADSPGALFGIVQGGNDEALRRAHVEAICTRDLPGYAIGGLSVGESREETWATTAFTAALLPRERPRYLMGVGFPDDLVRCVGHGVDMFDCVLPTRCARNGLLFTREGRLNIRNARWADHAGPVEEGCTCPACRRYSRAYLRHLLQAGEITGSRLATLHNLHFYLRLMAEAREAISEGRYAAFAAGFLEAWGSGGKSG